MSDRVSIVFYSFIECARERRKNVARKGRFPVQNPFQMEIIYQLN